jgi:hypothetical protein
MAPCNIEAIRCLAMAGGVATRGNMTKSLYYIRLRWLLGRDSVRGKMSGVFVRENGTSRFS